VIHPGDEGILEVIVETQYFFGEITRAIWVEMDNGIPTVVRFAVTVDSRKEP